MTIKDLSDWLDSLSTRLQTIEGDAEKCKRFIAASSHTGHLAAELAIGAVVTETAALRREVERMKGTP